MRLYATADEERIRLQSQVRDWTAAGLLTEEQGRRLGSELTVPFRRTGRMLRIGLAVFTLIVLASAVGLCFALFDIDSNGAAAVTLIASGSVSFAGAVRLVDRYRLYRYGVEEMLALGGAGLGAIGTGLLARFFESSETTALIVGLTTGAFGAFQVYRRFGLLYPGVAAIACVVLIPLQLRIPAPTGTVLAVLAGAGMFAWARHVRHAHLDDLLGHEARTLEAAAVVVTYLVLNLQVGRWLGIGGSAALVPWFKWTTYALVWSVPPLVVWLGVRDRERLLIDAGIVTGLGTLLTNKPYLGLAPNPWDPIVFGAGIAGVVLVIRRWLASGPGEARHGFTATRVSARDADLISAVGTISTAIQPGPAAQPHARQPSGFDGGRSGGGGASADF
jgi:hypothetical protein